MLPSHVPGEAGLRSDAGVRARAEEVSLAAADRVLTIKEICYVLKKSRWTVWRWKARGCPIVQGRILWTALLVWLEEDEGRKK